MLFNAIIHRNVFPLIGWEFHTIAGE